MCVLLRTRLIFQAHALYSVKFACAGFLGSVQGCGGVLSDCGSSVNLIQDVRVGGRGFSGLGHTSDFKIGTPVATLPGA